MVLTRKADELRGPVRDALDLIRSRIANPMPFDPATSRRTFRIVASDYTYSILLADMFATAARVAPGLRFEMLPPELGPTAPFDWREVDILIAIGRYLSSDQPSRFLFADEHAVICWASGRYAAGVTEEDFFRAGHAVAVFGAGRQPDIADAWLGQQALSRSIELRVPALAALPQAVIGTDRLALMNRRHADYHAQFLPIAVHRPPLAIPGFVEHAQWHRSRGSDAGLMWLLDLMAAQAALLPGVASR